MALAASCRLAWRSKGSWASGLTEPRPLPKLLGNKSRDRVGEMRGCAPPAASQRRLQRRPLRHRAMAGAAGMIGLLGKVSNTKAILNRNDL
jgi:hypothetical protein